MGFSVYIVFNGEAEDAIEHYKKAFQTPPQYIQHFNEMPSYENYTSAGYETRILHATMVHFLPTTVQSNDVGIHTCNRIY